jgi:PAS domain S-box-containing protein
MRGQPLSSLSDIEPGDHLCCFFESEDQHKALLARYLREGLERDQRVVYIVDQHTGETVLGYLREDGIDPVPYLESGQLALLGVSDTYMAGGVFEPEAMIALLRGETARAIEDGYSALRVTGEMTWVLRGLPGAERLIEYEALLNGFFAGSKCMGLCQYDMRRFDAETLLGVLSTHPVVVIGAEVYDNFHYVPAEDVLGGSRSAATLRQWLGSLAERKRMLAGLRAEQATSDRLAAILHSTTDFVSTAGPDGNLLDLNAGGRKMIGIAEDEDISQLRIRDMHPDWAAELILNDGVPAAIRDGVWSGQVALLARDGKEIPVSQVIIAHLSPDGKLDYLSTIMRDLSERVEAEAALRAANAYNRSLIEASPDPLVTIARDGKVTDVNRATEKVTGLSREQLVGTDFSEYFTDPERARAGYEQVFRDGQVTDYRLEVVHRDGHTTPVLYSASLYRNDAGDVMGVFAAARDITERVEAEAALRRASAYNRTLIEASLDPLVTIARDGKVTDVNRATERVTGLSREEIVGTDFSEYFTDPEKAGAGYEQVFRDGQVTDYRLEVVHRDGPTTPVLYNASLYRSETGEVMGVFAAARDITERIRQESQILDLNTALARRAHDLSLANRELERANSTLKRLNEEMTSFAYSVSHDLSSPLVSLQGMAGLLLRDYSDKLDEQGVHRLRRLQANVERMEALVGDLLELSRIGRVVGRVGVLPVGELARQAVDSIAEIIAQAGVEVSVAEGPRVHVTGDSMRFHQVFVNLLANAVKYMGDQERPRVEVTWAPEDEVVRICFADNGMGIAPEYHERIFQPFQRAPQSRDVAGTGMGLAIVRKIVEHHGGRAWVESEAGNGSRFYVTLPKADAADR